MVVEDDLNGETAAVEFRPAKQRWGWGGGTRAETDGKKGGIDLISKVFDYHIGV